MKKMAPPAVFPSRAFDSKTMKLNVFLALVFFLLKANVVAQDDAQKFTARNALYLELGGSSGEYAVNYSRIFYQKGNLKLNASAGFSLLRSSIDFDTYTSTKWLPLLPLEFTGFYGRRNHHLEMGFGFISYLDQSTNMNPDTFETYPETVFRATLGTRIGYRYQKPEGGFFFRVGYTPYFILPVGGREDWIFEPRFAGLSFGKSF